MQIPPTELDAAQDYLESIFARKSCKWCKDPSKFIKAAGLCGSCYSISRKIVQLESELSRRSKESFDSTYVIRYELSVEKRKEQIARDTGSRYGQLHRKNISGLDLEDELTSLSERFVKKDHFSNDASLLGSTFSPSQRRLVFYLISRMQRHFKSKHRSMEAGYHPDSEYVEKKFSVPHRKSSRW